MTSNYSEFTMKMQESDPDKFKEIMNTGKSLEKIAFKGDPDSTKEFYSILKENANSQYLTFSVFRSLKYSL